MSAMGAMQTVLLCNPQHAALLQPATQACIRVLLTAGRSGRGEGEEEVTELGLAAMAAFLGRVVLTSPQLLSVSLVGVSGGASQSQVLVELVRRWLDVTDSLLLSVQVEWCGARRGRVGGRGTCWSVRFQCSAPS